MFAEWGPWLPFFMGKFGENGHKIGENRQKKRARRTGPITGSNVSNVVLSQEVTMLELMGPIPERKLTIIILI
jgi:hypothetical protein